MKRERKIFIGYDSKQTEPYFVCRQSMIECGVASEIIYPLVLDLFESAGWYWRDDDGHRSTEFTNSRFLVPYLSGYYGQSIFCDNDFLWRRSPEILFDLAEVEPQHAVRVVKHDISVEQLPSQKMDGQKQVWYPKKNWSSLMVFNNAHPHCKALMPETVNESSAEWLHRFNWTDIDNSPGLPKTFNYLVDYGGYDIADPHAVHFTNGGPWLPAFMNVEYAKEWFDVQRRTEQTIY